MATDILNKYFPYSKHCWNPKWIIGSRVMWETGNPKLDISDVVRLKKLDGNERTDERRIKSRSLNIVGECTVTLLDCSWELWVGGTCFVDSEETGDAIQLAISVLTGQKIDDVIIELTDRLKTVFIFDLDTKIITSAETTLDEQWEVIDHIRSIYITCTGDGRISMGSLDESAG